MLQLSVDGAFVAVMPLEPFEFRGESKVACNVTGAPTRDFNVMTLRKECAHDVEIVRSQARFLIDDDEIVFAYALTGSATVDDAHIEAGETAYLDGVEMFDVIPADGGAVCLVHITPV